MFVAGQQAVVSQTVAVRRRMTLLTGLDGRFVFMWRVVLTRVKISIRATVNVSK